MTADEQELFITSDRELEELTALAEFEIEHRRMLAMQRLYQRRARADGAA